MLVLEYGIECDLLKSGSVQVVDGEIEITSEDFLRELKLILGVELLCVSLCLDHEFGGSMMVVDYAGFQQDDFVCLEVKVKARERKRLLSFF